MTTDLRRAGQSCRLASILLLGMALVAYAAPAAEPESGELLFRVHCAICHGEAAGGDGALAGWLIVEPPDLLRIAARNAGVFPADRVRALVDGRSAVGLHGPREMPIWGLTFRDPGRDADQESDVVHRIEALVAYLESIQVADPIEPAPGAPTVERAAAASPDDGTLGRGFSAYQRYCQTCHGREGVGDGSVAAHLKVPPSDLSTLSERHGGRFPEERVRRVIDGRDEVRTHGRRDMPVWGEVLGGEAATGAPEELAARIDELVEALRYLDAKSPER